MFRRFNLFVKVFFCLLIMIGRRVEPKFVCLKNISCCETSFIDCQDFSNFGCLAFKTYLDPSSVGSHLDDQNKKIFDVHIWTYLMKHFLFPGSFVFLFPSLIHILSSCCHMEVLILFVYFMVRLESELLVAGSISIS